MLVGQPDVASEGEDAQSGQSAWDVVHANRVQMCCSGQI